MKRPRARKGAAPTHASASHDALERMEGRLVALEQRLAAPAPAPAPPANTTIYRMSVTVKGETFQPIISIADNGIWTIANHEAFEKHVGTALFKEWLVDFWAARGTVRGGAVPVKDFSTQEAKTAVSQ